ncbi:MAG: M1 family metallopeptidase [Bacteroidetes bacterium]|nr:M1 family metallopeptidase [Bacteroidota bacterium]
MKLLTLLLPILLFSQSNRNPNNLPTRLSNGAPGSGYWQQQVDYFVETELITSENILNAKKGTKLTAKERIKYINNSPDTLNYLVWHLYQNIFKKGIFGDNVENIVGRAMTNTTGIIIKKITIANNVVKPEIDKTIMVTQLPTPLLPKTSIEINVEWEYEVPSVASLRTGSNGNDFGICQWYPQIATYDDQRGWDRDQYYGQGEFYLEYGNWDVKITLPANFIVSATGTLQNLNDVLTQDQIKRFNEVSSQKVTQIIPPAETDTMRNYLKNEKRTWHFTAKDVRDFAWAASPKFVWDATMTNNNVKIYAFYFKGNDSVYAIYKWREQVTKVSNWDDGANMARHSIEFFSKNYGNYIYPQTTVVEGPVYGMEYPMFIFAGGGDPFTNSLYGVISHELGHQWYPMMIGSQETNYAFMDEGFNTYITSNAINDRYGKFGLLHKDFAKKFGHFFANADARLFNQLQYLNIATAEKEAPLMTHSNVLRSNQFGQIAYAKPATVLYMLKDVLGEDVFNKSMLEYYNRWLLKHPYPEDFYNTIEDVSGQNLDWFWNQWFYKTSKLDLAIGNVKSNDKNSTLINFNKLDEAVMPFTLQVKLENDKIYNYRVPVEKMMFTDNFNFEVPHSKSDISTITIDPDLKLADTERRNNRWPSWSLDNYEFDFGTGLVNSIFPPIDKTVINFFPSLSYNLYDGVELGLNISTKYLSKYNFTETIRYDLKSKQQDIILNYTKMLDFISPDLTTSVSVLNSDGRNSRSANLNYKHTSFNGMFGNKTTITNFNTAIKSIKLENDLYVNPILWSKGKLQYGTISISQLRNFNWGKTSVNINSEFGLPGSDFYYGKIFGEAKLNWDKLFLRIYGGKIEGGTIPIQTKFAINSPTQIELSESGFFRSQMFKDDLFQKFTMAGGGNLFAKENIYGNNIIAANLSYKIAMLALIVNSGFTTNENILLKDFSKNLYTDISIGLPIELDLILPISVGGFGIGFYFPVAEKIPGEKFTSIKNIGQRLRVVLGTRLN